MGMFSLFSDTSDPRNPDPENFNLLWFYLSMIVVIVGICLNIVYGNNPYATDVITSGTLAVAGIIILTDMWISESRRK